MGSKSLFSQGGFIENKGQLRTEKQTTSSANFIFNSGPLNILFFENSFSYQYAEKGRIEQVVFEFSCKKNVKWTGRSVNGKINYFNQKPSLTAHIFDTIERKIKCDSALIQFIKKKGLQPKYNIITPVDKIENIRFKLKGVDHLMVNKDSLFITLLSGTTLVDVIPYSHPISRPHIKIPTTWQLFDDTTIGFNLDIPDSLAMKKIVIDPLPVLKWATYFGGGGNDQGYCVTTNSQSGHAYFGGKTSSNNNIASKNSYQVTITGSEDAFLTNFHKDGGQNSRIWATYFGGQNADEIRKIAVDKQNNILAVGNTNSDSLISSNSKYDSSYNGKKDAFLPNSIKTANYFSQTI